MEGGGLTRDTRTPSAPRSGRSYGAGWSPSLRFDAREKVEVEEALARLGIPRGKQTEALRGVVLAWARETGDGRASPVSLHAVAAGLEALEGGAEDLTLSLRHLRRRLTGEALDQAYSLDGEAA